MTGLIEHKDLRGGKQETEAWEEGEHIRAAEDTSDEIADLLEQEEAIQEWGKEGVEIRAGADTCEEIADLLEQEELSLQLFCSAVLSSN